MAESSKSLLPVYLFIGDDKLKRDALLARMRQRVSELGDIALNQANFEGPDIDAPDAVVAACNTMPFLSEKRLVVVKDIDHARKAVLDSLADYVKAPMESTVLVIMGEKLAKSSKLYKRAVEAFPKCYVDCESKKKRSEIAEQVRKTFANRAMGIDAAAVSRLIELVGTSTVALDAEARKVTDYVQARGRAFVAVEDVDAIVAKTQEPKPWDIADAMSRRDVRACMNLLAEVRESTPHATLAYCVKRVRELVIVKSLRSRPGGGSIEKALGGPAWRYKNYDRFVSSFREGELELALDRAAECERLMKTGSDPDTMLQLWLAGVCTGRYHFA